MRLIGTLAVVLVTGLGGVARAQNPVALPASGATWPPPMYLNDLACAPHVTYSAPTSKLHVAGSMEPDRHLMFATGQTITIDGGTSSGVQPGQQFFVRRLPGRFGAKAPTFNNPASVHTVGWVKILSSDVNVAIARVEHICDAILLGDYLEPFAAPAAQTILEGETRYDSLAKLLGGDEDRGTVGVNQYMTLDRGSDHGVKPGTRFVVLRDKKEGPLVEIGEGIVLQVRPETSTVQITRARDAVYSGDFAALAK